MGEYAWQRGELTPVFILGKEPANNLCEFSGDTLLYVVCLQKVKQNDKIRFGIRQVWYKGHSFYQWDEKKLRLLYGSGCIIYFSFLKDAFGHVFESPSEWVRFWDQNCVQLKEWRRKFLDENNVKIEEEKEEPKVEKKKEKKSLRKGKAPKKIQKDEIIMKEDEDPFDDVKM